MSDFQFVSDMKQPSTVCRTLSSGIDCHNLDYLKALFCLSDVKMDKDKIIKNFAWFRLSKSPKNSVCISCFIPS